jgi:outer membrane murein-binding lipoprotein Lpp
MKNRKTWLALAAAALLLIGGCFGAIFADDAVPGSAADPVVSKSYMDAQVEILSTQISDMQAQIDKLQAAVSEGSGTPSTPETPQTTVDAPKFEVVKVDAGKSIIGGASTEIVLRSGTATAIAGASGGVSDLTEGVDLATGTAVSKNHLLVIPVDDGRGIQCTSLCYVMVKGDYTMK